LPLRFSSPCAHAIRSSVLVRSSVVAIMRLSSNRHTNLQPSLLWLRSALQSSRQQLAQAARMNHSVDLKPHIELVLGPMYSGKSSVRLPYCGESRAFVAIPRQPKSALEEGMLTSLPTSRFAIARYAGAHSPRQTVHARKEKVLADQVSWPPAGRAHAAVGYRWPVHARQRVMRYGTISLIAMPHWHPSAASACPASGTLRTRGTATTQCLRMTAP
jgi:hypothetical protein